MNETQRGVNVRPWKFANHENRVQANIQNRKSEHKLAQPHPGNLMLGGMEAEFENDRDPLNSKNSNPAIHPNTMMLNNPKTTHENGAWITDDVTGGNSNKGPMGLPDRMNPRRGKPSKLARRIR